MSTRRLLIAFLCVYCVLCLVVVAAEDTMEDIEKEKTELIDVARRKQKHAKYFVPLLTAALLIKAVLFPLAFKSMAIMAGISIILSTLSLLVSSMVGFAKTAKDSYQYYASRRTQQGAEKPQGTMELDQVNTSEDATQNGGHSGQGGNRFILNPKLKTFPYAGYSYKPAKYV